MKSQLPLIAKKLYEKNLMAGLEGNLSEKKGDHILITGSQVDKSNLKAKHLCGIDLCGNPISKKIGGIQASSEKAMHLAIYKTQEKAKAIIHAHPPSAIALSLARPQWKYLPSVLPEMIVLMGKVPIVSYARPGTKELGEKLKGFVKKHQVLILASHGAVVWATSLEKAFSLMEQLEQCCKVLILAESLGGFKALPKKEREKLAQAYENFL